MTMPQAAGKKEGMQSKFELNRTKAADLRSIGNFNQANVPDKSYGPIIEHTGITTHFTLKSFS